MSVFYLVANNLGLDLVNTRIIAGGREVDLLGNFDDLLEWLEATRAIEISDIKRARSELSGTNLADSVFAKALELRDSLRHVADDLSNGRVVSLSSLNTLNDILKLKTGHFEVRNVGGKYEKHFRSTTSVAGGLLIPVAENAADLLSNGKLGLVRQCENPECILYFYDTTKNHKRHWCSMAVCGNRAKAAAHYKRTKAKSV